MKRNAPHGNRMSGDGSAAIRSVFYIDKIAGEFLTQGKASEI